MAATVTSVSSGLAAAKVDAVWLSAVLHPPARTIEMSNTVQKPRVFIMAPVAVTESP